MSASLDPAAVEALERLEKALKTAEREQRENGVQGHSIVANYDFISKVIDAAPELLALAKEALAAREWLKADLRCRAEGAVYNSIEEWVLTGEWLDAREAYADLVSAHQKKDV